jgi:hypothetical protein
MSEAQVATVNQIPAVVFSRDSEGKLLIAINSPLSAQETMDKYFEFLFSGSGADASTVPPPAELIWDKTEDAIDIGTSSLTLAAGVEMTYSITATETAITSDDVRAAIDFENSQMQVQSLAEPEAAVRTEVVAGAQESVTEPFAVGASAVTKIRSDANVTPIRAGSGATVIGKAAPSPLAAPRTVERLLKEGIGSKSPKQQPQKQKFRRDVAPAPVVHHSVRGRELLANALDAFRANGVDGIDFINTSGEATTKLGKLLDLNAHVEFTIPEAGSFSSVGAFWYYIAAVTPDEAVRRLHGVQCRNQRQKGDTRVVEGFHTLIAEATWAKVCSHKELRSFMVGNDLPYRHFFTQPGSSFPTNSKLAPWYMPILDEIGRTLKEIQKTGEETLTPNWSILDKPVRQAGNDKRKRY